MGYFIFCKDLNKKKTQCLQKKSARSLSGGSIAWYRVRASIKATFLDALFSITFLRKEQALETAC